MKKLVYKRPMLVGAVVLIVQLGGGVALAGENNDREGKSSTTVDGRDRDRHTLDPWVEGALNVLQEARESSSFPAADRAAGYLNDSDGTIPAVDGWALGQISEGAGSSDAMSFVLADRGAGYIETAPAAAAVDTPARVADDILLGFVMLLVGATAGGVLVHAIDTRRRSLVAH